MTNVHPTSNPAHRFAVIGGDLRMTHLCRRLTEAGHTVSVLGCGRDCLPDNEVRSPREGEGILRICSTLGGVAEGADVLILPLPATRDDLTIHCPRDPACSVTLAEITELMARMPRLLLFGGRLPKKYIDAAMGNHLLRGRVNDYYENEILQLRNAYLTAEAALMTAMELTDRAVQGSSVAVLGYGRIGKFLSHLLRRMGAEVTVCARREESLFEAAAAGCQPLLILPESTMGGMTSLCEDHTVLFNTIPAHILPRDLPMGLKKNTLLTDLASAPFAGNDRDVREATAQNGLRYLRAPSLPGSYAPRDAGRFIAECILDALSHKSIPSESTETTNPKGGDTP